MGGSEVRGILRVDKLSTGRANHRVPIEQNHWKTTQLYGDYLSYTKLQGSWILIKQAGFNGSKIGYFAWLKWFSECLGPALLMFIPMPMHPSDSNHCISTPVTSSQPIDDWIIIIIIIISFPDFLSPPAPWQITSPMLPSRVIRLAGAAETDEISLVSLRQLGCERILHLSLQDFEGQR